MRKLFQQKYILRVLAFLVLALAIVDVSAPRIEEYNLAVSETQERLRREAGGVDKQAISFGLYSLGGHSRFFTFLLATLFLSLIFTKRILLSFLSLFLFCVQLRLVDSILSSLRTAGYFPYPEDYAFDYDLLIIPCLVTLSFGLAIYICRVCNQRFESNIFLK